MSTTTSNIKISQLDGLSEIGDGAKLKIPVSKDNSATSTPDWASYSVSGNVLSSFMENSLDINGLRTQIGTLDQLLGDLTLEHDKHMRDIGYYPETSTIPLTVYKPNRFIGSSHVNGGNNAELFKNDFNISNTISLSRGCLYLLEVDPTYLPSVPPEISFVSKVHTYTYNVFSGTHTETKKDEDGNSISVIVNDWTTSTNTVYSALPTKYVDAGYPNSGYLVFFATEDQDVVISAHKTSISGNSSLIEVKYGAFFEIANNLLTLNGELMKVIIEAIVKNKKDIDSLYENTGSFQDIHVKSIDSDEFPSVQGAPMVIVADRDPSASDGKSHGDDVPNRIGQIWVNTKSGVAYIATKLGNISGWKQITA